MKATYPNCCPGSILALVLLTVTVNLHADFSGSYAPGSWTVLKHGGNGSVDWSFAPGWVELNSGTHSTGTVARIDLTVRIPKAGKIYFEWSWSGGTASGYRCTWLSNGVVRTLAIQQDTADGTFTTAVRANDFIGFRTAAPKGKAA